MLQGYNLWHDSCFSFVFFITNKTDLNGESNKRAKWPVEWIKILKYHTLTDGLIISS